jgi:hypothetical protein
VSFVTGHTGDIQDDYYSPWLASNPPHDQPVEGYYQSENHNDPSLHQASHAVPPQQRAESQYAHAQAMYMQQPPQQMMFVSFLLFRHFIAQAPSCHAGHLSPLRIFQSLWEKCITYTLLWPLLLYSTLNESHADEVFPPPKKATTPPSTCSHQQLLAKRSYTTH